MGQKRKITPIRVVLDTNVLVSALLFQTGPLSWLRSAWHCERILPLTSGVTVMELIRVLAYPKFALNEWERNELLDDILPFCDSVTMPPSLPAVPECWDIFDIPFLALALVGHAEFLVTGDKDLLALSEHFSVPILEPTEFKETINF